MGSLTIPNFLGGVNEALDESLIGLNEASNCYNVDISDGTLRTRKGSTNFKEVIGTGVELVSGATISSYTEGDYIVLSASNNYLYKFDSSRADNDHYVALFGDINATTLDFINFQIGENRVLLLADGIDNIKIYEGVIGSWRRLRDRRIVYNADGTIKNYVDALGVEHATESEITTYAPKVKFIELNYDRIFGAGDEENPDRLYFSTAGVNGPDIEDWTAPISEGEANQHGGFIDVPTWDGGRIIGLKTVFNDLLIFKDKQIFKLYGSYPGNYQVVQLFSSSGAISDKSIVVTPSGCYFANADGIYRYDGTNCTKISDKIKNTYKELSTSYRLFMDRCTAIFYDNKYFLALPINIGGQNGLIVVYDTITNTFNYIKGIIVKQFIDYKNKLLFFSNDNYIHELFYDTAATYNETVNMKWQGVNSDLGSKNTVKTVEYLYFTGSGSGDVKFTIETDRKNGVNAVSKTQTLTSQDKVYKLRFKTVGRTLKLIIENVSGSNIKISGVQIVMEVEED